MATDNNPGTPPLGSAGSPQDAWQVVCQQATAGDLDAVMAFVRSGAGGAYSLAQVDGLIQTALEQLSRMSPSDYTDKAFQHSMNFLLHMLLRLQTSCWRCVDLADQDGTTHAGRLTEELARVQLPAIERVTRLLGEQSLNWATTRRRWKLAQADPPRPRGDGPCQCPADLPWPEDGAKAPGPRPGPTRRNHRRPR